MTRTRITPEGEAVRMERTAEDPDNLCQAGMTLSLGLMLGSGGGGSSPASTAGQPIGLLLALTKAS